jgi:hypothetical protein
MAGRAAAAGPEALRTDCQQKQQTQGRAARREAAQLTGGLLQLRRSTSFRTPFA